MERASMERTQTPLEDTSKRVLVGVAISLLTLIVAGVIGGAGQHPLRSGSYRSTIESLLEEAKVGVEVVRGLSLNEDVRLEVITTRQAIERWAPKGDKPSRELLLRDFLYKATFLLAPDEDVLALSRKWVGMFLAAASGTTIYVNVDYFNPQDPNAVRVLLHELMHIAQHLSYRISWPETTDERNAMAALVEGDADFVSDLYCQLTSRCKPGTPWPVDYSNAFISLNVFPYAFGRTFVQRLYEVGGWDLVNRSYENPPRSTLMVMVPEAYLAYLLEGVSLEVECPLRRPWIRAELVERLGAYYLLLVVGRLSDNRTAWSIAMGWRGDQALVADVSGAKRLSWRLCFSSLEHAEAFGDIILMRAVRDLARLTLTPTGFEAVIKLGNEWYKASLRVARDSSVEYLVHPTSETPRGVQAKLARPSYERLSPSLPTPA